MLLSDSRQLFDPIGDGVKATSLISILFITPILRERRVREDVEVHSRGTASTTLHRCVKFYCGGKRSLHAEMSLSIDSRWVHFSLGPSKASKVHSELVDIPVQG